MISTSTSMMVPALYRCVGTGYLSPGCSPVNRALLLTGTHGTLRLPGNHKDAMLSPSIAPPSGLRPLFLAYSVPPPLRACGSYCLLASGHFVGSGGPNSCHELRVAGLVMRPCPCTAATSASANKNR